MSTGLFKLKMTKRLAVSLAPLKSRLAGAGGVEK